MFTGTSVILLLNHSVHINVTLSVRSKENIDNLLSSPQLYRLNDARRWNLDPFIRISKIAANHHELTAIEKGVFLCDKIARGQEILSGRN